MLAEALQRPRRNWQSGARSCPGSVAADSTTAFSPAFSTKADSTLRLPRGPPLPPAQQDAAPSVEPHLPARFHLDRSHLGRRPGAARAASFPLRQARPASAAEPEVAHLPGATAPPRARQNCSTRQAGFRTSQLRAPTADSFPVHADTWMNNDATYV